MNVQLAYAEYLNLFYQSKNKRQSTDCTVRLSQCITVMYGYNALWYLQHHIDWSTATYNNNIDQQALYNQTSIQSNNYTIKQLYNNT